MSTSRLPRPSDAGSTARRVPGPLAVSLYVSTLGAWMGAALFFSGVVLPALFLGLEPREAGGIAALLFPHYFRAGLALGVASTAAALLVGRGGGAKWRLVAATLAAMTAAQAWSTLVVHPEMASIRGVDAKVERFQELHRLSVRLNGAILVSGVLLLASSGFLLERREPAT